MNDTALSPGLAEFAMHQRLMNAAATGDLDAQREMRNQALASFAAGNLDLTAASFWAMIMARLASAHGHRVDKLALASTLCFHAAVFGNIAELAEGTEYEAQAEYNRQRHDELVGEAYAILDTLADGDDEFAEQAACYLQNNAELVRPEVLETAKDLQGLV